MISDEKVGEFKARYGEDLAFHDNPKHGIFVFRKPSRPIWKKFQGQAGRKGADTDACGEQMVIDCYCFPEGAAGKPDYEKLTALFDEYAALPSRIFAELYELAQGRENASGKL